MDSSSRGSQGERPHKHSVSPTPLGYPQLWEAARTQCGHSHSSSGAPIWTSGQRQASLSHVSFLLHQTIRPVRPALRNQSSRTFFSERAAQGHEAASPPWPGKRDWKRNLRHLKRVLKCNKNILNPLKPIAVRGVCKASNFQLLQGTLQTTPPQPPNNNKGGADQGALW